MMQPADYAAAFKGSAIKRAKLWMLKRNACVLLGNVGTPEDVSLMESMLSHDEPIVREHVACMLLHTQQRERARRARQRVYLPTIERLSSHPCSAPLMDSQ